VELIFRISGRGKTGGDGLAFWYVAEKPEDSVAGSVFGGFDGAWEGLGLFWDSYDNDANFNNPAIIAIKNDGSKVYDNDKDGHGQYFGSCTKDFRNKMFYSRARITYNQKSLLLYTSNGRTREPSDLEYEPCFYTWNISLPEFGYFGVSASTSGRVADDHDVAKFLTFSIPTIQPSPSGKEETGVDPTFVLDDEDDSESETAQYKKSYLLEHPGEKEKHHNTGEPDDDAEYETDDEYVSEVRSIFKEQGATRAALASAEKALQDVLQKHETISLAVVQYQAAMRQNVGGGPSVPITTGVTQPNVLQRVEVDELLRSNRDLLKIISEIKNLADELERKSKSNLEPPEFPGIPSANTEIKQVILEIEALQSGLRSVAERFPLTPPPPRNAINSSSSPCTFCISTKMFVLLNALLTLVILACLIYKDKKHEKLLKSSSSSSDYSPSLETTPHHSGPSNRFHY
ncbi:Protein ERGIC-53, partial [Folsomia candida]